MKLTTKSSNLVELCPEKLKIRKRYSGKFEKNSGNETVKTIQISREIPAANPKPGDFTIFRDFQAGFFLR